MTALSDGYALNARTRSQHAVPTATMVDALVTLEADMRMAAAGQNVLIEQWVQWARKDRQRTDALIRVLFLVVAVNGMSADDVHDLRRDFQQTTERARRPVRPIRETQPRKSQQLW